MDCHVLEGNYHERWTVMSKREEDRVYHELEGGRRGLEQEVGRGTFMSEKGESGSHE